MDELDVFIEWIEARIEDEELVAWLHLINSVDEIENPQIATLH